MLEKRSIRSVTTTEDETYLKRACFDATKLADQGSSTDLEGLGSTSIELSGADGQVVGTTNGSSEGRSSEEDHGGSDGSEDGGGMHFGRFRIEDEGLVVLKRKFE